MCKWPLRPDQRAPLWSTGIQQLTVRANLNTLSWTVSTFISQYFFFSSLIGPEASQPASQPASQGEFLATFPINYTEFSGLLVKEESFPRLECLMLPQHHQAKGRVSP